MKRILLIYFLLMSALITEVWAQRTVSGKVTSTSDGEGIPGVTVVIKGTSQGVSTDFEGNYRLEVPSGDAILVYSSIGFGKKEVKVGNQSTINVTLEEDVKQLQEIVVTGYSQQDKKTITGAVASVGAETIEMVPIASLDQILQGQAPGLLVTAGSGQPGAAARVRIRGTSSISGGNDPLYVMDGVPIDAGVFTSMNPNDIESVNVLKDASAAAIYGSRAANGVVVITTKKGKAGDTQITFRTQQGWSEPGKYKFSMMNTEQKIRFEQMVGTRGASVGASEESLAALRAIDTDWKDVLYSTGTTSMYEVSARGGSEKTIFYISGNYFDQKGIGISSGLERYTGRFNIDHSATDKFRLGLNSTAGFSKQQRQEGEGQGVFLGNPNALVYLLNPYERPYNPETGELVPNKEFTVGFNPLERINGVANNRDELKVVGNVYAEYDVIESVTARTSWGVDYRTRKFEDYVSPTIPLGASQPGKQGRVGRTWNQKAQFTGTTTLNYIKAFNDLHNVNILVGGEIIKQNFQGFSATGYGVNPKLGGFAGVTAGTATNGFIPRISGFNTDRALASFFSQGIYTYNEKYTLNLSFRRDGSSRFGENNKFANFWSVGANWNAKEEDFLKDINKLSTLRLRASYGTTGNQDVAGEADFPALGVFGLTSYNGQQAIAPTQIANPDLKWEVTTMANVGVDFGLFEDRILGTVELYNNLTSDLYISTQLSRTSGFFELDRNAGEMRNKGIEVMLTTRNIETEDFSWSTTFNFTYNKNRIEDLFQTDQYELGTFLIKEGLPYGSHYIVGYAGVNPANGDPLFYDTLGNVTNVYSDAFATATHGTFEPPYFGSFGTNARYKGFELSAFFTYVAGNAVFNNNTFFLTNPNFVQFNQDVRMLDAWQQPGDITQIPRLSAPRRFTSFDIEDGDFLRLRNVSLAYNLPQDLLKRAKLNFVKVSLQAQNLYTWTKYSGFDPEEDNNIEQFDYPAPRTITFGLEIGL